MSLSSALRNLLHSKEAKDMSQFIPYGSIGLATLVKMDEVVHDAKAGNPVAVETVKEVAARSAMGDPVAETAVATMKIIGKAQNIKTAKARSTSLYARGISVGHDAITFGAVRDQRGGAGGGGGVTVTSVPRGTSKSTATRDMRGATGPVVTDQRGGKAVTYYGPPAARNSGSPYGAFAVPTVAPPTVRNPTGKPLTVNPFPTFPGSATPADPGAVPQDPYGQYPQDPYGQYPQDPYGQYGYPQYPQYPQPQYGGYPQYPAYDPYAMYGLEGLPPGYGYEEPIQNQTGYQTYDPDTNSFYSSNQKQVYDEETGMFVPVQEYNPYAAYGF